MKYFIELIVINNKILGNLHDILSYGQIPANVLIQKII